MAVYSSCPEQCPIQPILYHYLSISCRAAKIFQKSIRRCRRLYHFAFREVKPAGFLRSEVRSSVRSGGGAVPAGQSHLFEREMVLAIVLPFS